MLKVLKYFNFVQKFKSCNDKPLSGNWSSNKQLTTDDRNPCWQKMYLIFSNFWFDRSHRFLYSHIVDWDCEWKSDLATIIRFICSWHYSIPVLLHVYVLYIQTWVKIGQNLCCIPDQNQIISWLTCCLSVQKYFAVGFSPILVWIH